MRASRPGNGSVLPPGPRSLLVQGALLSMDVYGAFDRLARKYGDTFTFPYTRGRRMVLTGDPRAIQQVFGARPGTFRPAAHDTFGPIVGEHSLFLLEGERHLAERRTVGQPLQGHRMRAYAPTVLAVADWHLAGRQPGDVLAMNELAETISLEVIIRLVFGVTDEERVRLYREVIGRLLGAYSTPLAYWPALRRRIGPFGRWARFLAARRRFHQLVEEDQARGGDEAHQGSVLEHLRRVGDVDGPALSRAGLRDELVTLLLAGHETTARALAWALYLTHINPAALARLLAELDQACTPEAAVDGPYLDAVCSEALRLNPIVTWVERVPIQPFSMLSWTIAPGDIAAPCVFLAHRREDLYPEPLAFRPERFLERKYAPYEYLPFGGGTRRCIGESFGLQVVKLVLASLLTRWRLEVLRPDEVRPARRGASVGPSGRLDMRIVARR